MVSSVLDTRSVHGKLPWPLSGFGLLLNSTAICARVMDDLFSKYLKVLKSSVKPYYALGAHGTPRYHPINQRSVLTVPIIHIPGKPGTHQTNDILLVFHIWCKISINRSLFVDIGGSHACRTIITRFKQSIWLLTPQATLMQIACLWYFKWCMSPLHFYLSSRFQKVKISASKWLGSNGKGCSTRFSSWFHVIQHFHQWLDIRCKWCLFLVQLCRW